jgi:hypothetical protein
MMRGQTLLFILAFVILAVQGPNYPHFDQMTVSVEHDYKSNIDFHHPSCVAYDNADDDEDDDDLDLSRIFKSKHRRS